MSDMERDARRREVRAAGGTRLTVADLINVGVFGAVYFALVGVAALASMAVFGVAGNILLPAIAAVLAGPVFMLMVARVRRFGAITLMGLMLGLFLFVSGHFATSLVTAIVFPLAADCIARFGGMASPMGAHAELCRVQFRLHRADSAVVDDEGRLHCQP